MAKRQKLSNRHGAHARRRHRAIALFALLAGCISLLASGAAQAADAYSIRPLPMPRGQVDVYVKGINNLGHCVGYTMGPDGVSHAILWNDEGANLLPTLSSSRPYSQAYRINDAGQIAGKSFTDEGNSHAVYWDGGAIADIGVLPGGKNSFASDINQAGVIAGSSEAAIGQSAFTWTPGGGFVDYGNTDPPFRLAVAGFNGLNNNGLLVGTFYILLSPYHAVVAHQGMPGLIDLSPPGRSSVGMAMAVNDAGTIVGYQSGLVGGPQAAIFHGPLEFDLLGTLGLEESWALDINETGVIVGTAFGIVNGQVQHAAFVYDNGPMQDLLTLVPADSGWEQLLEAAAINDQGAIVGSGIYNGEIRGFIATPIPEPGTWPLLLSLISTMVIAGTFFTRWAGGVRLLQGVLISRRPKRRRFRRGQLRQIESLESRQMLNAAPVANDDFYTSLEDTVITGNLVANDTDADGDPLELLSTSSPSGGALSTDMAGNFTFTPNPNFVGDVIFSYTVADGNGGSDTASVTIRLTNVNDSPDARNDAVTTNEQTVIFNALGNDADVDLANPVDAKLDTDPPDALRVISVGNAVNGRVSLDAGGLISYTPNKYFAGTDLFEYTISDRGQDGIAGTDDDKTDSAKVVVTVIDPYFEVIANDDTMTLNEDVVRAPIAVLKNDFGNAFAYLWISDVTPAAHGIIEVDANRANVLYTPEPNFFGVNTFSYTVTDSRGATDTATVTVTVANTPDAPVAQNDFIVLMPDSEETILDVLANDTDTDGDQLTITQVTQGASGTVAIGPGGGHVTYTPEPGFSGNDVFTYTITDPNGASDTAIVLVEVSGKPPFTGGKGDDVFYVRLDSSGANLHLFANDTGAGTPIFSVPIANAPPLSFRTLGGDDRLIIDAVNGNPIPAYGIQFSGGDNGAGSDRLLLRGIGGMDATYMASPALSGAGVITLADRIINFSGVESIDARDLSSFHVQTPNADDTFAITRSASESIQIAGASGAVALSPVTLTNVSTVIIDAATNDRDGGNDSLTIHAEGGLPGGIGFLEYQSGVGTNTLAVHNGLVRIDSTVAGRGSLNTTVGPGAGLVTHRLRQNELVLADDARATILSNIPGAAASVVDSVHLGAGAALDITNNAIIIDYAGPSPLEAVMDKILAGRGSAGLGNGAWTGTGISSSVAAMANAADTEAWSVGFAENDTLQLKSFRGVAVDETALLIAFTRTGDANLDGVVDDEDVTIVNANYAPGVPTATWAAGDFDYNGFVDDDDVTLLGAFYNPADSQLRLAGDLPDRFSPSAYAAPTGEVITEPVRRRRN